MRVNLLGFGLIQMLEEEGVGSTVCQCGRLRQMLSTGDAGRIASVPGMFGKTRFLRGGLGCERGQWWTNRGLTPAGSSSSTATHRDAVAFKRAALTLRCRRAFCAAACQWPQRLHWPLPE